MPTVQMTDIVARAVKAHAGSQVTYWDATLPNFGLRVGACSKTWTVLLGSERRRVTLGRYPKMTVHDARTEARRLIAAAATVRNDADVAITSFPDALETFVDVHLSQKKESTAKDWERVLRRHFAPVWKKLLMHEIRRGHVARVIDPLLKAGGEANNAFAVVRVFLRWSLRRGYLAHNPIEALRLPVQHRARHRVLSSDELKAVLRAADTQRAFDTIVLLLLLTGQRRGEIGGLRSEWIDRDNKILTLPSEITKNKQEHVLPLTPCVLSILPERAGLLFPARGTSDRPFNGWSKCMMTFRSACGVELRLHDLRRTAATTMARLGVPPYVIERILNHITASTAESITPLARIYNRHRYLDEMRSALLLLEDEILRLHTERCGVSFPDAGLKPSQDLALNPGDAARAELDPLGKAPGFLQAVDVGGRIKNENA